VFFDGQKSMVVWLIQLRGNVLVVEGVALKASVSIVLPFAVQMLDRVATWR
jgi:hypothetical protein